MVRREWKNQEVANLLREVAAAYTVKGDDKFRIAAYEEAAVGVEHASSLVRDMWEEGKLEEIPGVGKAIAEYLDELFRTGRVRHFEDLIGDLPPAMFELLPMRAIGPKTAYKLAKALGITKRQGAVSRVARAAQEGQIAKIPGFGEEMQKKILEVIKEESQKEDRMPLMEADELADRLTFYLKEENAVLTADPLGSLRRRAATVGDVDISVATREPKRVLDHLVKWKEVKEVLAAGENTARVLLNNGKQVDVKTVLPDEYGALLQHYTGSKQHNIHLRTVAQEKGLSLSEYGIKINQKLKVKSQKLGRKINKFATEEGFYKYLGMEWIPPEMREDKGEIEVALKKKVPKVVGLGEIKGDLHIHSDFRIETSHDEGASSMVEIMKMGESLGYEYVGLTEHNPSHSQHTEARVLDILKRKKGKIEQINGSWKAFVKKRVYILNGLEVDIRPDGELAVPEKALDLLDFAIVSVHGSFDLPEKKMTDRVIAALSHPKCKILGHPTGRIIGRREEIELDWERLFDFCKKNDKWLEINAWPWRLDLPDYLVREAVRWGVKLVIGTDSHVMDQMKIMEYGVSVARRGWACAGDIVNTLSEEDFSRLLK